MKKLDTLNITGLKVSTKIGVYTWEQRIEQPLLIDISLNADFSHCQEDLEKTINYAALCEAVTQFVETRSFQLIETVANEVAELIQQQFKVAELSVAVSKPHAVLNAGNVQVIVRR